MGAIFEPEALDAIVRPIAVDDNRSLDDKFDAITEALAERWPGHIDTGPRRWIFNNAGGAMGQMCLLHASLTEYLIFFGTPIGTEGHSGRYATDVWDFMIDGECQVYVEGELERTSAVAGGPYLHLGADRAKGYRIPDHGWMLEYARGPIPTMLPFGLADTLVSTLDWTTLRRTLVDYGRLVTREILRGKI
ncbi:MAG: hypothetical protein D6761_06980 [Candidatus Dadabacteria bacterium]|nr:MAG: hypothetical protein D6761_06980 [Candidatus Dadabacteria bacterium]